MKAAFYTYYLENYKTVFPQQPDSSEGSITPPDALKVCNSYESGGHMQQLVRVRQSAQSTAIFCYTYTIAYSESFSDFFFKIYQEI